MFRKYGKFRDAAIATDRHTGNSRGFGFITFEDEEDAKDAIDGLNDRIVEESGGWFHRHTNTNTLYIYIYIYIYYLCNYLFQEGMNYKLIFITIYFALLDKRLKVEFATGASRM